MFRLILFNIVIGQSFILCSWAQSSIDSVFFEKIDILKKIKQHCRADLGMAVQDYFYRDWAMDEGAYISLYVSEVDTLRGIFGSWNRKSFGKDLRRAEYQANKYISKGFQVHLYRTAGNATTELSRLLLSYPSEDICFIAFHEATHHHIRVFCRLASIVEEAVCDLVGNYASLKFSRLSEEVSFRKVKRKVKMREMIAMKINQILEETNSRGDLSRGKHVEELEGLMKKWKRRKEVNQFMIDRYWYPINNAYFLRNRIYTAHYFELKEILKQLGSINAFLSYVTALPSDARKAVRAFRLNTQELTTLPK